MNINPLTDHTEGRQVLLLGNEAIARGILESGVQVVAAYPGTPSTEIVGALARVSSQTGQHVEWSINEKVAFECAAGAAFMGVRSFSAMKNVGLNVAMEPLMVVTLTGIAGGFVFLVADDPNCWSSQNEQDGRLFAHAAEIPCLEPSSIQDAKDMVPYAYDLSEKIGRAVMIRTVTRINHSRAPVKLGPLRNVKQNPQYYGLRAGFPAVPKHIILHERMPLLREAMSDCPFNRLSLKKGARFAVIASGNAVNYAKEALSNLKLSDEVSMLEIGSINPLPLDLILKILDGHDRVVVLEEIEPFIEGQIRSLCYDRSSKPRLIGKFGGDLEIPGELTLEKAVKVIAKAFNVKTVAGPTAAIPKQDELLPPRDAVLCAGCPHMGTFYAIRRVSKKQKIRTMISGDIGCYGLGVLPPYDLFDSHICMGASIGIGNGFAATGYGGAVICVLGDSTLFHSGVPALIDAVINKHNITVVVLDNAIIGMTGHQPSPGTGVNAMGEQTTIIDIEAFVRACGVEYVDIVDPFEVKGAIKSIEKAAAYQGPSVVIARGECAIITGRKKKAAKVKWRIEPSKCNSCGVCVNLLYCPALTKNHEGHSIDEVLCVGCGICQQVCPKSAIVQENK